MNGVALSRPSVGDFVALVRRRRRMSQRTLSTLIGRSPAYVHKIEAGQLDPSLRGFAAVAVALEMNPLEVWTLMRLALVVTPPCHADHQPNGRSPVPEEVRSFSSANPC